MPQTGYRLSRDGSSSAWELAEVTPAGASPGSPSVTLSSPDNDCRLECQGWTAEFDNVTSCVGIGGDSAAGGADEHFFKYMKQKGKKIQYRGMWNIHGGYSRSGTRVATG